MNNARNPQAFRQFHPGVYLADELEALSMSSQILADKLGVPQNDIEAILGGQSAVTPELAAGLERVIGPSATFWLGIQQDHDAWILSQASTPNAGAPKVHAD